MKHASYFASLKKFVENQKNKTIITQPHKRQVIARIAVGLRRPFQNDNLTKMEFKLEKNARVVGGKRNDRNNYGFTVGHLAAVVAVVMAMAVALSWAIRFVCHSLVAVMQISITIDGHSPYLSHLIDALQWTTLIEFDQLESRLSIQAR